jgi:hypothetical protein
MQIDEKKLEETKKKAKEIYEKIGKVWCPCLKDEVFFNNEGFDHILFKTWNRGRSSLEQYTRLRLISLVPDIITRSHTLQEYDERKMLVRQNINSRWEKRAKLVRYYVFIAIIKEVRLKIIIKEIEGGNKIFYSLYPSWKTTKNSLRKKIFFSGNLEED